MFGTNSITGKSFFKTAPKDSLFVTSMFMTLQGEGPYAGMPALFVRLAKCNLTCSFCDTFFDDGEWLTYPEIEVKMYHTICDYWNNQGKVVPEWVLPMTPDALHVTLGPYGCGLVVTGGEPLLQENLIPFLKSQIDNFTFLQIESNGTIDCDIPQEVTLVCSPKCAEKEGKATKYLSPSKLILNRADCLKFVVSSDLNSPYSEVPQWAHEWAKDTGLPVYVSPMNVYNDLPQKIKLLRAETGVITMSERSTVDETIDFWEPGVLNLAENEKNHKYTAKYCLDNGFKLNLQMHLYAGLA